MTYIKKITLFIFSFVFITGFCWADSDKNGKKTELNFYTGMFDFSDDGKRASLVGLEHRNDDLFTLQALA